MDHDTERALDEQARRELEDERVRHQATLARIAAGDADAFVAEFERHMDRVTSVLDECSRRRAGRSN